MGYEKNKPAIEAIRQNPGEIGRQFILSILKGGGSVLSTGHCGYQFVTGHCVLCIVYDLRNVLGKETEVLDTPTEAFIKMWERTYDEQRKSIDN